LVDEVPLVDTLDRHIRRLETNNEPDAATDGAGMMAAGLASADVRESERYRGAQASGPRLLVFGVNETLLDIGVLAPHFLRVFGDASVQEWFSTVLLYSQVTTIAGPYTACGNSARTVGNDRVRVQCRTVPPPTGTAF
jgi:hypothetical protein